MGAGYGFAGSIGFAKESSGGTPVTVTSFLEALSENITDTIDRFETKNITNDYAEPDDQDGIHRVAGNVVAAVHPTEVGHFLLGAMGINSITLATSLYTHEFTMRSTEWDTKFPLQPYTFEVFRDVTSAQQYAGVNVNTLEFNVAPNQDLRMTAGLIGVSAANVDETTASFTATPAKVMAFDTASIAIGGSATAKMEALTISINNQLEGVPVLNNSTNVAKFRRTGFQTIRLSGTLSFEDITEYLDFQNQTERQITASFFRSNSFSIGFDLPRVVYTAYPLGISGRGRQTISFEGMARKHVGSGNAIKVTLKNTTASY